MSLRIGIIFNLVDKKEKMGFNILTLILIITVLISMQAMQNAELKERWMYSPYLVKHNHQGYRIFSHIWIHADVAHLFFNMFSLYALGGMLEMELMYEYGRVKGELHFAIIYLLGGLFATLIPYIRNHENPAYRSIGASGAVSAIVFAAILWRPEMELQIIFIPISFKAYWFGLFYLAYEVYMDKRGNTGIAHDAHIGGAILGIFYILLINFGKLSNFVHQFIS
jgi:membrane associated rhomboid family serine protease